MSAGRRQRSLSTRLLIAMAAMASLAIGFYLANDAADKKPDLKSAYLFTDPQPLPLLHLTDEHRQPFTNLSLTRHWNFFIAGSLKQTSCQQLLSRYASAWNRLAHRPKLQKHVRVIFLSLDTPPESADETRLLIDHYNPDFTAITGNSDNMTELATALGISGHTDTAAQNCEGNNSMVSLVGPDGKLLASFSGANDSRDIAHDIEKLIDTQTFDENNMNQPTTPTFKDKLLTGLLRIAPQHLLADMMHQVARIRWEPFKTWLINYVIDRYKVDMSEAQHSDPGHYASFNEFFTRALQDDARPIDSAPESIVSPADGTVSQAGRIDGGVLIQAKGHEYQLFDLLAGDDALEEKFRNGSFATIYLSPRDYHRVHIPASGTLKEMHFVPGKLFSVSDATTQLVPELFARNERVITVFETEHGPMAVILVGAIFVGSMETIWSGEVHGVSSKPSTWYYLGQDALELEKGSELGRFNMGSTVILLFPQRTTTWDEALQPGAKVKMGQAIGQFTPLVAEKP